MQYSKIVLMISTVPLIKKDYEHCAECFKDTLSHGRDLAAVLFLLPIFKVEMVALILCVL